MDPNFTNTLLDDLPLQPTGSGVADLEIAHEQMRLADAAEPDRMEAGPGLATDDADLTPIDASEDAAESAAHPS